MNDACWENIKPDAKGQDRALSLCISPHIGGGLARGTLISLLRSQPQNQFCFFTRLSRIVLVEGTELFSLQQSRKSQPRECEWETQMT